MKKFKYKLIILFLIHLNVYSKSKIVLSVDLGSLYTFKKRITSQIFTKDESIPFVSYVKYANKKRRLENMGITFNYYYDITVQKIDQEIGLHFGNYYEFDHNKYNIKFKKWNNDVTAIENSFMGVPSINLLLKSSYRILYYFKPNYGCFVSGKLGLSYFLYFNKIDEQINYQIKRGLIKSNSLNLLNFLFEFGLGFIVNDLEVEFFIIQKFIHGILKVSADHITNNVYKEFLFDSLTINISLGYVVKKFT